MVKPPHWMAALACVAGLGVPGRGQEAPSTTPQATPTASEANPATPAPGHSLHGETFDDGPRQRAHLMAGMGQVRFPVTTPNPEAQAFVEQGVSQLHSFYYLEAERSFRTAAELDPDCALAYWGMAMANTNNEKRAKGFLKVAREKVGKRELTRRETLYIEALEGRYRDKADAKARRQAWLVGLEAVVQEAPDDLEARTWLCMVTWENSGKDDGIGSRQAIDLVLESAIATAPLHPGAHHYTIHLWDSVKQEQALASAARYAEAAPGIAHAWHMPGHTYTGLKRYRDAAYQQEGSARVDHAMMLRERVMPFEIHNYAHNNQWLCTSLSHIGRVRDALSVARDLVEQPRDPQKNNATDGGSPQRSGRARWVELLTRYELWDQLRDDIASGELDWSDVPQERKDRAFAQGLLAAATGQRPELTAAIDALKALLPPAESKDEPKKEGRGRRPSKPEGLYSALAELEGNLLLLDNQPDAAVQRFQKASLMRKDSLARAYLRAGRSGDAEKTAREAVEQNVNQLPPALAIVEILHAVGKTAEAQEAYQSKVLPMLAEADSDLPAVRRVESLRAAWRESGWPGPEGPVAADEPRREKLAQLGPLTWSPYPAPRFEIVDTEGQIWKLSDRLERGQPVVVLFFLGGKCAHCMQQLELFGKAMPDLQALGVEIVAVSTDDAEATRLLKHNAEDVRFPMPLLADPELKTFRPYRAHDDFENQPLHGTFLIDGHGGVRFHRISAEPFLDVEFVKKEAARIVKLTGSPAGGSTTNEPR